MLFKKITRETKHQFSNEKPDRNKMDLIEGYGKGRNISISEEQTIKELHFQALLSHEKGNKLVY